VRPALGHRRVVRTPTGHVIMVCSSAGLAGTFGRRDIISVPRRSGHGAAHDLRGFHALWPKPERCGLPVRLVRHRGTPCLQHRKQRRATFGLPCAQHPWLLFRLHSRGGLRLQLPRPQVVPESGRDVERPVRFSRAVDRSRPSLRARRDPL
jgi:hypothetical protein